MNNNSNSTIISNNNNNSCSSSTPMRHNYAAPHTPIASAKRPRSSTTQTTPATVTTTTTTGSAALTTTNHTNGISNGAASTNHGSCTNSLSPLHPPRPVTSRSSTAATASNIDTVSCNAQVTESGTPSATGSSSPCVIPPPATLKESISSSTAPPASSSSSNPSPCASSTSTTSTSTWVGRQVDALFSPVLNFLHHPSAPAATATPTTTSPSTSSSLEDDDDEDVAAVTDEDHDVTMEDALEPSSSSSNGLSTADDAHHHHHLPDSVPSTDSVSVCGAVQVPNDDDHVVMDVDRDAAARASAAPGNDASSDSAEASNAAAAAPSHEDVDEEDEFNPYLFIKSLPPYELVAPFCPPIALPPKPPHAPPISLILDLDETLVHCSVEQPLPSSFGPDAPPPPPPPDLIFPVLFHGMTYQVAVRLRPHLFRFLESMSTKFEVVVFTASQRVYADELLNLLDPENKYIHHRLFRESCLAVEGNFLKDLNVLGRDLRQTVLVDNSPHAFGYQMDNGIPIESWFEDPHDTELLKLEQFLMQHLMGADDVRTVVRDHFQTFQRVAQA